MLNKMREDPGLDGSHTRPLYPKWWRPAGIRVGADLWTKMINDPFRPFRNNVIQDPIRQARDVQTHRCLAALPEGRVPSVLSSMSRSDQTRRGMFYHASPSGRFWESNVVTALQFRLTCFLSMGMLWGSKEIARENMPDCSASDPKTGCRFHTRRTGSYRMRIGKRTQLARSGSPAKSVQCDRTGLRDGNGHADCGFLRPTTIGLEQSRKTIFGLANRRSRTTRL